MARRKPKYLKSENHPAERDEPRNRIAADLSQQAPHKSFAGVPLFYEDLNFVCEKCGSQETWTAEQQKWWYEEAKGYIFSRAIYCRACRKAIRDAHGGTPRRSHRDRREHGDES